MKSIEKMSYMIDYFTKVGCIVFSYRYLGVFNVFYVSIFLDL